MRRFDICELRPKGLIIILQHPVADGFDTRIVAPLSRHVGKAIVSRARIPLMVDGHQHVLQLDRMAAVSTSQIGAVKGSADGLQDEIKNGIDLLLFGF